jgi:acyl-CoA thioesterase-1
MGKRLVLPLLCILASVQAAEGGGRRLIVFGDSLCAGTNIADGKPADAWPALVQAKGGIGIINRSRGGRPTASLAEFSEALASAGAADAVLIALGTNDSRTLDAGMVQRAVANIGAMVGQAREHGIRRIIIVGPPNLNPDALKQTHGIRVEREANLRQLGAAFEAYARANDCVFVPLYGIIPVQAMAADGVHPDKAGNLAIAEFIAPKLAAALP